MPAVRGLRANLSLRYFSLLVADLVLRMLVAELRSRMIFYAALAPGQINYTAPILAPSII
jgi:hypothetical protein